MYFGLLGGLRAVSVDTHMSLLTNYVQHQRPNSFPVMSAPDGGFSSEITRPLAFLVPQVLAIFSEVSHWQSQSTVVCLIRGAKSANKMVSSRENYCPKETSHSIHCHWQWIFCS